MKKIAFLFILFQSLIGCHDVNNNLTELLTPVEEFNFTIERRNSSDDYISIAQESLALPMTESWNQYLSQDVSLSREFTWEVALKNGEMVKVGFWFQAYESEIDLLKLTLTDPLQGIGNIRNWHYKSIDDELARFYQNLNKVRILVDNDVVSLRDFSEFFIIEDVRVVKVNGEDKIIMSAKFEGNAFPWYIAPADSSWDYQISNGFFTGIVN